VEELGLPLVQGDARQRATWEELGPETIQAVAVLLPDDDDNLTVSRLVREELGIGHVAVRVHETAQTKRFTDMDVEIVNPSLSPVVELEYLLLYPGVSSLITDLEDEHDIAEVRLNCPDLIGPPIRDLELPYRTSIVLVRRNGDVIYPRGHTVLEYGDMVTIIGPLEGVRELARRCE
jgi:Trk K+ transport system NAD-binding subunit